jgi:hypothetical protein
VNGVDPTGLISAGTICGEYGSQSSQCAGAQSVSEQVGQEVAANQIGSNRPIIDIAGAVGNFVSAHAGEIATAASLAALLIPGVDVIDLGVVADISVNGALSLTANTVAVSAGGLASEQDFSQGNYLSGTLDLIGSLAGLSGVHLQGLANLEEFVARGASNRAVASWLLENAAGLTQGARITAASAFGLGLLQTLLAGLPAGASTCG